MCYVCDLHTLIIEVYLSEVWRKHRPSKNFMDSWIIQQRAVFHFFQTVAKHRSLLNNSLLRQNVAKYPRNRSILVNIGKFLRFSHLVDVRARFARFDSNARPLSKKVETIKFFLFRFSSYFTSCALFFEIECLTVNSSMNLGEKVFFYRQKYCT